MSVTANGDPQKMANGKWQMADGKWQMADGKWQMADGKWQSGPELYNRELR
jgi:hypothetical protein